MEWNGKNILVLESIFEERWERFKAERKTDRKNLSELWNLHIAGFGVTLLRHRAGKTLTIKDVLEVLNFRNDEVSNALCIRNPDRFGQYLFVPREAAEKFLVLGVP